MTTKLSKHLKILRCRVDLLLLKTSEVEKEGFLIIWAVVNLLSIGLLLCMCENSWTDVFIRGSKDGSSTLPISLSSEIVPYLDDWYSEKGYLTLIISARSIVPMAYLYVSSVLVHTRCTHLPCLFFDFKVRSTLQ